MNNIDINVKVTGCKQPVTQRSCVKKSFHKGSLLQSKKIVSGEISKEPFFDILLTDFEQSSFSLLLPCVAKTQFLQGKAYQNEVLVSGKKKTYLKTSSYLFNAGTLQKRRCKNEVFAQSTYKASLCNRLQSFALFKALPSLNYIGKGVPKIPEIVSLFDKGVALPVAKQSFALRNSGIFKVSGRSRQSEADAKTEFLHQLRSIKSIRADDTVCSPSLINTSNSLHKINQILCLAKVGDYVHSGDKIGSFSATPIIMSESGKVLKISQTQITIQKMQPVLFYSQAEIHVESNEWVKRGTPLLTLAHQTLVTGDIVQGIPRIEQLFEASTSAPPGTASQDFGSHSEDDFSRQSSIDDYWKSQHTSSEGKAFAEHLLPLSSSFTKKRNYGISEVRSDDKAKSLFNETETETTSRSQSGALLKVDQTKLGLNQNVLGAKTSFLQGNNSTVHSATEEKPMFLYKTLQSQVRETFRKKWDQLPLPVAVRQSLEEIQQIIVESIQKVYISQGVLIADKHIEIIVRQMTSKAQVFDGGSTGLLIDEVLSLQQIENANLSTPGQKAFYLPVIMGLTRAALSSDSFVSAASFQETTRVLSRDAVAGKTDFLRGLKEKVIIGDLIDAGTGLDAFYIYSLFSKKIFENKFREILNRKVTHKTLKKLVLTVAKSQSTNEQQQLY